MRLMHDAHAAMLAVVVRVVVHLAAVRDARAHDAEQQAAEQRRGARLAGRVLLDARQRPLVAVRAVDALGRLVELVEGDRVGEEAGVDVGEWTWGGLCWWWRRPALRK